MHQTILVAVAVKDVKWLHIYIWSMNAATTKIERERECYNVNYNNNNKKKTKQNKIPSVVEMENVYKFYTTTK